MAAKAGHVDILKYLVENDAEVNAVAVVKIDMYNITYRLHVFILCYSFQNSVYYDNTTDGSISVLCLCWFLLGRFSSHVIKRMNYAVEQGARVDVGNDATIIMYNGTQRHTLYLIALSSYFIISNNVDSIMEWIMTFVRVCLCRCVVIRLTLEGQLQM